MFTKRITKPTALFLSLTFLAGAFVVAGFTAPTSAMATKKADRLTVATDALCASETWPSVSQACLQWTNDSASTRNTVRVVTIEKRDEASRTSTLIKTPVALVASR
ncbi:MAG: hypothetical protein C0606_03670 [Hyphomicrobiales bacterium]|nr:MAG: hypothetical protein C0606_03670 [Hyphomicrobiales bacterium]